MTLETNTEHVEIALSRLLYQFKDQPVLEAFVSALVAQFQDAENTVEQLLNDRQVDVATGENLDVLGRIVGQTRDGRTDADYRIWIKARILINRSSGTAEELYAIFSLITGDNDTGAFWALRTGTASFRFTSLRVQPISGAIIHDIVDTVRGAGIDFSLVYTEVDSVFRLDVGPGLDSGHLATLY